MNEYRQTTYSTGNLTTTLTEKIVILSEDLFAINEDVTDLTVKMGTAEKNNTLIINGIRNLEKHFIDIKRDQFEKGQSIVTLNESLVEVSDEVDNLKEGQSAVINLVGALDERLMVVANATGSLNLDLSVMWNNTATLSTRLQSLAENFTDVTGQLMTVMTLESRLISASNK